jgi:hypothetical protein
MSIESGGEKIDRRTFITNIAKGIVEAGIGVGAWYIAAHAEEIGDMIEGNVKEVKSIIQLENNGQE